MFFNKLATINQQVTILFELFQKLHLLFKKNSSKEFLYYLISNLIVLFYSLLLYSVLGGQRVVQSFQRFLEQLGGEDHFVVLVSVFIIELLDKETKDDSDQSDTHFSS